MKQPELHISLTGVRSCLNYNPTSTIVLGTKFIKLFCLGAKVEICETSAGHRNFDMALSKDKRFLFVTTDEGVKKFLSYNLAYVDTVSDLGSVKSIHLLSKHECFLIADDRRIVRFDMDFLSQGILEDEHEDSISSISSTFDEDLFFSTGADKILKKWNAKTWKVESSVELSSPGCSLLVLEGRKSVLVGMENGSISEYSIDELSLLKTYKVHMDCVTKMILLPNNQVISSSHDGYLRFLSNETKPTKITNGWIYSLTLLDDNRLVFSCGDDGIKVLPVPKNPCDELIESISSNLKSISSSTSPREPQLISLLQHHLAQLMNKVRVLPEKFTGLSISLFPEIGSLHRSHFHRGSPEGKTRILNRDYLLEMSTPKSNLPDPEATIHLFKRQILIMGTLTNKADPLSGFKVQQIRKRNWVFRLATETPLSETDLTGPATVDFVNGSLTCFVVEGQPLSKNDFQAKLKLKGEEIELSSVGMDGLMLSSKGKMFKVYFQANVVRALNL